MRNEPRARAQATSLLNEFSADVDRRLLRQNVISKGVSDCTSLFVRGEGKEGGESKRNKRENFRRHDDDDGGSFCERRKFEPPWILKPNQRFLANVKSEWI